MCADGEQGCVMELDRLDLAILDHLQANGRATAQELGEAAHLSPRRPTGGKSCWRRPG